ncbi:MAG: glycosyltransferase family 39 protein [Acidimicrobiia bacterium]|nr:glycosyltransferase family 39 protein [Acidimicrobiia bacterium]
MRWFGWRLLGIGILALAVRLAFAFTVAHDHPRGGFDAARYTDVASTLADGHGYSFHPGLATFGRPDARSTVIEPDGQHPPLHPVVLATADVLGFHSADAHRAAAAVASALGVVLTGLAGRRLVGATAGLVGAGIAAVNPLWFQHAGYLVSEATVLLVVPLTLLVAAVALDTGRLRWFLALGVTIGLCALTRGELVLLVALLGIPAALIARDVRRLAALGLVLLGAAVVVGPWVIRNDRTFGEPAISYNTGITLAGANCAQAYHGRRLGGYGDGGFIAAGIVRRFSDHPVTQADVDRGTRHIARTYVDHNLSRVPVVVLARVGRTFSVSNLGDSLDLDVDAGANRGYQVVGYAVYWVTALLAIGGAVGVRRRGKRQLIVLASGPAAALAVGVFAYGATRFRVVAEPAIALLAAAALVEAYRWWSARQDPSDSTSSSSASRKPALR